MTKVKTQSLKENIITLLLFLIFASMLNAKNSIVKFDSKNWDMTHADIVKHLGRNALRGVAVLKDVEFENGTIEFDMAINGNRSYPGVIFRHQSKGNYENFYLRPHHIGLYPDVLQYSPVFDGVTGWQLYSGKGFTAPAYLPKNKWFHMRIAISGKQAKVYLNNSEYPALSIPDLKRESGKGKIILMSAKDNSAYFSNFEYKIDNNLKFEKPEKIKTPFGTLLEWEISKSFNAKKLKMKEKQFDIKKFNYPNFNLIYSTDWEKISAEKSGLVDIAKYIKRNKSSSEIVFARKIIRSDKKQDISFNFGYSDEVAVFLNGKKVFYGNSAYKSRDPSFAGIIGLNDSVYLSLEKGQNEIFLIVKEKFGGWGFICKIDRKLKKPIKDYTLVKKLWETGNNFLTPESVQYDKKNNCIYVTSFDVKMNYFAKKKDEYTGFISKLDLNGKIKDLKWIDNLFGPTGMAIYKNKLYVAERKFLTEIDIKKGKIIKRYPIPFAGFPNDVAADSKGNVYITDTVPYPYCKIYKFKNGEFIDWKKDSEISRVNGLFVHNDTLLVGNSGDGSLKAVALKKKDTLAKKIITIGAGIVDGIRIDNHGNYLLSLWKGNLFLVKKSGKVIEILNTEDQIYNIADFEYIKDKNMVIIPTFYGNKVVAYQLEK